MISTLSHYLLLLFCYLISHNIYGLTDKYRCMWRDDPATSMVIGWNQISGSEPVLYYDFNDHGQDVNSYSFKHKPDRKLLSKGMHNHFARLHHLQPATVYYFVIADSEGVSERMSFRTAPDCNNERLSIIAGGDSRNFRDARRRANAMVSKLRPHCIMFGGDMTGGDNAAQWNDWFDDWQATIGSDGRLTPIIVARGNHEYSNATLTDLFDVSVNHLYYGLNLGGDLLRIYTLNSLVASGGDQRDWLAADLEEHQHMRWKTAQYHFPIRPHMSKKRDSNDQYKNWAKLFDRYGVNLASESDAHCVKTTYPIRPYFGVGSDEGFIRDDQRGTVYIGEGCWGAPLRRNDNNKSWTRDSDSFNQFSWIFVDYDKMEVRTILTDLVDKVDEIDHDNIFLPPSGLSLWEPSNGAVIYIYPMDSQPEEQAVFASLKQQAVPKTEMAKDRAMQVLDFRAYHNDGAITLFWQTSYEPVKRAVFELQRSLDGKQFSTIATLAGQGMSVNDYRIKDEEVDQPEVKEIFYRLNHNVFNGKARQHTIKTTRPALHTWREYTQVNTDPNSGLLKINYALDTVKDVSIVLLNEAERAVSESLYLNQRPGHFLKSINMRDEPGGLYLLTITSGTEIIKRVQVQHLR